jgi:DNA-binding transcriptional ArsR family regulator
MTTNSSSSMRNPEQVIDASDTADATDAFALLSDETRVSILQSLAAAEASPEDPDALSFSELRTRVGVRDGGLFNYHLRKLRGQFVEKTDDGYRLTTEGRRVESLV